MSFVLIWKEHKVLRRVMALGIVLCGLATPVYGQEKPGLAALNLKAQRGVEPDLAEMISDATLSLLRASGRFQSVIGSSDIQAMITAEQQKQAVGCEDDSCLAQLGGALGVPYLLTGSLGVLGGRFMLNVKLLDVDQAKVAGRLTQMFGGERALADGLPGALDSLLKDAFGAKASAPVTATEVAPAVAPQTVRPSGEAVKRGLGATFAGIGLSLGIYSYFQFSSAQQSYDEAPSDPTQQALIDAARLGDHLLIGSALSVGLGSALWLWGS